MYCVVSEYTYSRYAGSAWAGLGCLLLATCSSLLLRTPPMAVWASSPPEAKLNPILSQDVLALSHTPLHFITLPLVFLSHFSPHFDLQFQSSSLLPFPSPSSRPVQDVWYNLSSSNDDSVSLVKGNNDLATLTAPLSHAALPCRYLPIYRRGASSLSHFIWARSLTCSPCYTLDSTVASFSIDSIVPARDLFLTKSIFFLLHLPVHQSRKNLACVFTEHCPPPGKAQRQDQLRWPSNDRLDLFSIAPRPGKPFVSHIGLIIAGCSIL